MGGEWPLVAFTITGQLAVGAYLFLGVPIYFGLSDAAGWLGGGGRPGFLLAVLGLLAVATVLSFFHLHHPVKAYRTLVNLGRSWLSREILSLLFFATTVGVLAVYERRRIGGPGLGKALFIVGGLAGLLFLLSMSKLYMLPSVPTWNRLYTPLSFFLTSAVLGACAAVFLLSLPREDPSAARPFLTLALCGLAASFLNAALLAPVHGVCGVKPLPSLRPPGFGPSLLHAVRLSSLVAGGVILAAVLATGGGRGPAAEHTPAILAGVFVLAAASEVSGRFLFYGLSGRRS
jgi:anaerobic dimethyl sulfoxide reductase subunit C (anchor subunit)